MGFHCLEEGQVAAPIQWSINRGIPKAGSMDELQLCAQKLCLEEMLCCSVPVGRFITVKYAVGSLSTLRSPYARRLKL